MTPDVTLFSSLGVGGATLFIIWRMVSYFMTSLDAKDAQLKTLIIDFQKHIEMCNTNFIKNSQLVSKNAAKQAKAIEDLVKRIRVIEHIKTVRVNTKTDKI